MSPAESVATSSPPRAMVRGGGLPAGVVAVVLVAACGLRGAGPAASAALGAVLAILALGAGPAIMAIARNWSPPAVMAAALVGYAGAVVVLGVAYLLLAPLPWVAGHYVGVAIIATAAAWIAGQLRAVSRLRILAYGSSTEGDHGVRESQEGGSPASPFQAPH